MSKITTLIIIGSRVIKALSQSLYTFCKCLLELFFSQMKGSKSNPHIHIFIFLRVVKAFPFLLIFHLINPDFQILYICTAEKLYRLIVIFLLTFKHKLWNISTFTTHNSISRSLQFFRYIFCAISSLIHIFLKCLINAFLPYFQNLTDILP